MNADKGFSRVSQSYFRTASGIFISLFSIRQFHMIMFILHYKKP